MQQTENLKLNLIETGDLLSPAPINENAEKIEAALTSGLAAKADAAETSALEAELNARVTILEAKSMVTGSYTGTGVKGRKFLFDRTPGAVWLFEKTAPGGNLIFADRSYRENMGCDVALGFIENGFQVGTTMNKNNTEYVYLVLF